jgi:pantoate--beta-alanine ligase
MLMETITTIEEMQTLALAARASGRSIAFVPTMGYLHKGHQSLLNEGRKRGDLLVLSIFVNPTQFGQGEDLGRYPRDFDRDEKIAQECGVDIIFYPQSSLIYPDGFSTYVTVDGPLTSSLEGACRPSHFRGVTTVVAKLFSIVLPHMAFFGQKDFQQLAVIKRMTADMNFPIEIVAMPTVREQDGLAMSSRNVYLSQEERIQARALSESLNLAVQLVRQGEMESIKLIDSVRTRLALEPDLQIDYVKICDAQTLEEMETINQTSVMLLAARVGRTRLIDNSFLIE